jgi:hypothetical protein
VQAVAVDPNDDALATIDAALAGSGARKLVVLCHGQAGELRLGAEPIRREQLLERVDLLTTRPKICAPTPITPAGVT